MSDGHPRTVLVSREPPVWQATAPNPGPKTLGGTHAYLIGRDPAYLLDPGPVIDGYTDALAAWIRRTGARLNGILLSHAHPDHAPGAGPLADVLAVPIWGSPAMDESEARVRIERRYGVDQQFAVEGGTLRVVPTPGHSPDHVAFWLEEPRILFSGDTILGEGSTLVSPPDGDMQAYMRSLRIIRDLEPLTIAPGHGPVVTDPRAKIDEYVRHREEREAALVRALESGPATPEELVRRLYTDVDPALHRLARGSVLAQLAKLEAEGRVRKAGDGFALT